LLRRNSKSALAAAEDAVAVGWSRGHADYCVEHGTPASIVDVMIAAHECEGPPSTATQGRPDLLILLQLNPTLTVLGEILGRYRRRSADYEALHLP
jgi:hypothetical protein